LSIVVDLMIHTGQHENAPANLLVFSCRINGCWPLLLWAGHCRIETFAWAY